MSDSNSKVKEALRLVERDWNKQVQVTVFDKELGCEKEFRFKYEKVIGNGSFGIVCEVKDLDSGETLAIKKVFQDKGYQNRELQIMKNLSHPNVVNLKKYYYSKDENNEGVYLNLVLDFVPSTVYRSIRNYTKNRQYMPIFSLKIFKSLKYIHSIGICHRDIKPQNLLLNPETGVLKLCDFGSAKKLVPGEENISYICSRYYRAPEVIFGSSRYTVAIDVWSVGCVMAEMLGGRPFFMGKSSVDQLVEIIKVLGSPTREDVEAMNQNYSEFNFPDIKPQGLAKFFPPKVPTEAIDLLAKTFIYDPKKRITAIEALNHEFFDELKSPDVKMPSGISIPKDLFDD